MTSTPRRSLQLEQTQAAARRLDDADGGQPVHQLLDQPDPPLHGAVVARTRRRRPASCASVAIWSIRRPSSQNLLAGINNPAVGTVQTNFYNRTRAARPVPVRAGAGSSLDQRLSVTAGVTAERTTNDGDIKKFYATRATRPPIASRSSSVSSTSSRSAQRTAQSGTQPLYGVRYTTFPTTRRRRASRRSRRHVPSATRKVKPESETEIETGFDATMFHSRAQLTFTVYQKRITNRPLASRRQPVTRLMARSGSTAASSRTRAPRSRLNATPVQLRNGVHVGQHD